MKQYLILFVMVIASCTVSAQTEVQSPITESTTWTLAGSPYILGDQYVEVRNDSKQITLTIEAGVVVQGEYYYTGAWPNYNHSRLEIGKNAALVVYGTSGNPVRFTKSPTSLEDKSWGGIIFTEESRASQSSIQNAIFEYAGGEMEAVIEIYNGAPQISNVVFDNSGDRYIYAENSSAPIIQNCTFNNIFYGILLNNSSGKISSCHFNCERIAIELDNSFPILSNNIFANDNFVRLNDMTTTGTLGIPGTLLNGKTAPYSLGPQYVQVNDCVLTIEEGVVIEGEYYYTGSWPNYNNSRFELNHNAAIKLNGTAANPIVFTKSPYSLENKSWGGLIFHTDADFSGSIIQNVIFENGGGEVDGALMIRGGNLTITNCTFKHNSTGLSTDSSAIVKVSNSSFIGNNDNGAQLFSNSKLTATAITADSNDTGISIDNATLTLSNSTIQNSTSDGISIDNGKNISIDACIIKNNKYDGIWIPQNSVTGLTVLNSAITGNQAGLNAYMVTGSTVKLNNCEISGNTQYGVRNRDKIVIDAKNNWWGDASGSYDNSNDPNDPTHLYNPNGTGDEVTDYVDYGGWLTYLETESPNIVCMEDVPNDQGRWIHLCWTASSLDVLYSVKPIIKYSVWRLVDPNVCAKKQPTQLSYMLQSDVNLLGSEGWDFIDDVTAVPEYTRYFYVVPTLGDSTANGVVYSSFMVIAHTSNPSEYYKSKAAKGYSVDNLAPTPPANMTVRQLPGTHDVQLKWNRNSENDLDKYIVYKNGSCLGETIDTFYVDRNVNEAAHNYKISAIDYNGNESESSAGCDIVVGIESENQLPKEFALYQNYPNPFNPSTEIKYQISELSLVQLIVYDLLGREISRLVNEEQSSGYYKIIFNGKSTFGQRLITSGIYIYTLRAGNNFLSRKMMFLK